MSPKDAVNRVPNVRNTHFSMCVSNRIGVLIIIDYYPKLKEVKN